MPPETSIEQAERLVRIEGTVGTIKDSLERYHQDHEARLRVVETQGTVQGERIKTLARTVTGWSVGNSIIAAVAGAIAWFR